VTRQQNLRRLRGIVFAAIGLLAATASGCATSKAAQDTARLSAQSVNEFKVELANFVDKQNDLHIENLAEANQLKSDSMTLRADSSQAYMGWQSAGDKKAVSMYDALTQTEAADIKLKSIARSSDTNAIVASVNQQQFNTVIKELNALAASASVRDQLSAYVDYGKAVNSAYKDDVKKANSDAANSGSKQQATKAAMLKKTAAK
jgi:hypothetical protein